MKGGKIGKGGEGRKRPASRPGEPSDPRTGPKRGEPKRRDWGAFDNTEPIVPPAPPKRLNPRKK